MSAHRDGRDRIIILPARDTLLARDRQEAGSARPMTGRSGQQLAEQRDVNRLDQVVIEARGARPLPVFFLSPARERHQSGLLGLGSCSESPGDFVSVHARHTDVKDHHFWLELRGQCEGRWAVMGHLHGVSIEHRQETRQAGGRVLVVVHDEDAATVIDCSRPLAIATTRFGFHRRQGVREDRQPDEELAAPARAIALL